MVQFAAKTPEEFVSASLLVQDSADGVDLNCGCPQRWAWKEGIGACLIHRPEMLQDLVRQVGKISAGSAKFLPTFSIKSFFFCQFFVTIGSRMPEDYVFAFHWVIGLQYCKENNVSCKKDLIFISPVFMLKTKVAIDKRFFPIEQFCAITTY